MNLGKSTVKAVATHREAKAELDAEISYYNHIRDGLGDEFVNEVEKTFRRIQKMSRTGTPLANGFRRMRVERFPFWVIYREEKDRIWIIAIEHGRRRPGYWARRMDS